MKTVGILGGGQLGTMLGTAIADLGARVAFFEPDAEAPACHRFPDVTIAPWDDAAAIRAFADRCDVVTYEMEHVTVTPALRDLAARTTLRPGLGVLETTQDRAREKEHLRACGLPHAAFSVASDRTSARALAAKFPRPFIIKTTRGGYDGKGQLLVREGDPIDDAFADDGTYVFEEALDLVLEASCIVARSPNDEVCFPVFENVHSEHILDVTLLPARLPPPVLRRLEAIALETARSLDVHGLLTVEFFLTRAGSSRSQAAVEGDLGIFVNELAPRPHNSGHVTRKACTVSQFEALARILLDLPIGRPALVANDAFCMGNLLGDVWIAQGRERDLDLAPLARFPDVVEVVLYGKSEARERRKMGHYTCRAASADEALRRTREFREALRSSTR
jgi:5-(carboxyamino)imidazole ribonucleotide synthase